jgi:hypothetical protein
MYKVNLKIRFCFVFLLCLYPSHYFAKPIIETLPHNKHADIFNQIGRNQTKPSDKVAGHTYGIMYGLFLVPIQAALHHSGAKMKMFEIGLGCGHGTGPGASVALWKGLFAGDTVELWEGEFDAVCVEESKKAGQLEGINTLTGTSNFELFNARFY